MENSQPETRPRWEPVRPVVSFRTNWPNLWAKWPDFVDGTEPPPKGQCAKHTLNQNLDQKWQVPQTLERVL